MIITDPPARRRIVRIAVVGAGKITLDQHLPSISRNERFELAGIVSPRARLPGVQAFASLEAMLADGSVNAVAINTPPQVRFEIARASILAGKHVILEKPPAATVGELREFERLAGVAGITLFTAWHSQHAPAVASATEWLVGRVVTRVTVEWCEDVRQWHPGQRWIWEAGGLGVFDPGINALSILSAMLPEPLRITAAMLDIPENCQSPIAADLRGEVGSAGLLNVKLDFRQTGLQTWSIDVETESGTLAIAHGGAKLTLDGERANVGASREYPALYDRFVDLIDRGESEVDAWPLALVADAFLVGERRRVAPFIE